MPMHFHASGRFFTLRSCTWLLFLLATIASRWAVFGYPFIHPDEQFYLFVGGRMLHGDIPYVDIWDRKPIGIFLIYEFFHLFGPYRIQAYQIGALLSVWLTSILCHTIARFISAPTGAFLAGLLYIFWSAGSQGAGGQSPIFYNPLVASSILLAMYAALERNRKHLFLLGTISMTIMGVALQIKTSVIFEGIYIGLFLLFLAIRFHVSRQTLLRNGFVWMSAAALPSLLVMAFYGIIGHFQEWYFANVTSIILRGQTSLPYPSDWLEFDWGKVMFLMLVLIVTGRIILWKKDSSSEPIRTINIALIGWACTAFAGFYIFGSFSKHYALPLYMPYFIIAAPLWRIYAGRFLLLALCIWGLARINSSERKIHKLGDITTLKTATRLMSQPQGCVFNFAGPNILLDSVPYCPLTRFPFSSHLRLAAERNALGVDPAREVQHILAQKPAYILMAQDEGDTRSEYRVTYDVVKRSLKENYNEIYRHHVRGLVYNIIIYRRK